MKVEIVTPAGRKKSLQILYKHLASQTQYFNKWTLWINTQNQEDIQYCKFLEKTNNWIKTIDLDNPYQGCLSIYTFFKHAEDLDSIYIRLDDDIVWLSENFIKNLSDFRIKNPKYFLVYMARGRP